MKKIILLSVFGSLVSSCGISDGPSLLGTSSVSPTVPPISLAAKSASNSIILTWASVSGASSYNAYCSSSAPVTTSSTKYTGVTSPYIVTGLSGGINEYCAVTSVTNGVESTLSLQATASPIIVFTSGQNAANVIGQTNFTSAVNTTTASNVSCPWGKVGTSANGAIYITDYGNQRILGYNSIPTVNGAAADFVIGQPDFVSDSSNTTINGLHYPYDSAVGGATLAIADYHNSRVLLFTPLPNTVNPSASVVLGQPDFTSSNSTCTASGLNDAEGVSIGGGKLVVADTSNNRVLIWNSIPTSNNQAADLVLGQTNLTSCNSSAASTSSISSPASVWTDGTKLLVSDSVHNRILLWNSFPTSNNQPADVVLGQTNFTNITTGTTASTINPGGYGIISSNGTQIFYSDTNNNRILVWNSFPITNGVAADVVLGQANFTSGGSATTVSTFNYPAGVSVYANKLMVADCNNNRVMVFQSQ